MSRLSFFVILLALLLAILIGIPFLLQVDRHRTEVASYLTLRLGHPVVIAKMDAGFFPPSVRLHDVAMLESSANSSPILHSDTVEAALDWGNLFHLKAVPGAITFTHFLVTAHRRPDGSWDWDHWLKPLSSLPSASAWPVTKVVLHQGEFHAADPYGPQGSEWVARSIEGAVQSGGFKGTATWASATGPISLSVDGKGQATAPSWSADVRLGDEGRTWTLHLSRQANRFQGTGESAQWRLDNEAALAKFYVRWPAESTDETTAPATAGMLQDWKLQFDNSNGAMRFSQTATVGGGQTEVKVSIQPGPAGPVLHGQAAIKDVPLQAVEPLVIPTAALEGKLTAAVPDFSLVFSTAPWASLTGKGTLQVAEGRYHFPQRTLQTLAKAHTVNYLRHKYSGFEEQGLAFSKARADVQAGHGFLSLSGSADAGSVHIAVICRMDEARRGIDGYARLQIHESSPAMIKLIPGRYVYGSPRHEQIQPIYGHMQGPWNEWLVRAAASGKVPGDIRARLGKL